jgi:O-antigen/teichoic acid export membrane protein
MLHRRILKLTPEALWVLVEQLGIIVGGFAGVKLLTYVLAPSEYGRLAIANTITVLIGTNLFCSISRGLMRFWSISKERKELRSFYAISTRYTQAIAGLAGLLTIVSISVIRLVKDLNWVLLVGFSMLAGAAMGWLGLRISIFTAVRQRRRIALLRTSNAFLRPLVAVFLLALIGPNANWAIIGYLMATVLIVLVAERLYRQTVSSTSSSSSKPEQPVRLFQGLGKEIFSYSWPFFIWGIFGWIHMSCDRWSLQAFHGSEVVGAFAIVSQLATFPLVFISSFLSSLLIPIAFQRAGNLTSSSAIVNANKILLAMTGFFILGSTTLIGIFAIFHRPLILIISNESFARLSYLLPGLTTAWAFFHAGQLLSIFGFLVNRTHSYIVPKLVAAMVAALGTFYLSAKMGPPGVVLGLGIAGVVYTIWCMVIALKLGILSKMGPSYDKANE